MTRFPGPAPGACFAGPRSPRFPPFAPPAPPPVARHCSQASSLLWQDQTSRGRASSASAPRLPDADQSRHAALVNHETSRFPYKERLHMPGSATTPGRRGACDSAPLRVAFRVSDGVGTRNIDLFAAQWLACTLPCQRFTYGLTTATRMTRGRCGSLLLHRSGLAPPTLCRFRPAHQKSKLVEHPHR